jgi:hypothetical protein
MDLYCHKSLSNSRSIRLLNLLPSGDQQALQCKLIETSLDDQVDYEALSYVWGEQNPDVDVVCEGEKLALTNNCRTALQRLQYNSRGRMLWVDAICIDQGSISERNHQVRLMREIYSRARQVLIWLGHGTADSSLALEYLSQFATGAKSKGPDFIKYLACQLENLGCKISLTLLIVAELLLTIVCS